MISVDYLKRRVETLARKARGAGYATKDEFNSDLQEAQSDIFEYYLNQFEITKKVSDALIPFIKEELLTTSTAGIFSFPSDYRHWLEVKYRYAINNDCSEPEVSIVPVDYMRAHEEAYTLSSPIRKPSLAKKIMRWTSKNNKIYVYPPVDRIEFKYFINPPVAKWESIIQSTPTGDMEVYDPANSIDLIWDESETSAFVDVLLLYLGIQTKDTELINYITAKKQIKAQ